MTEAKPFDQTNDCKPQAAVTKFSGHPVLKLGLYTQESR